jgi:hypothetical protein
MEKIQKKVPSRHLVQNLDDAREGDEEGARLPTRILQIMV